MKKTGFLLLACAFLSSVSIAQDKAAELLKDMPATATQDSIKKESVGVAIIFEVNVQKSDKSFTEMAMKGANQAQTERGIKYQEFQLTEADDREAMLKQAADSGANFIIAVGFENVAPVMKLAEQYPQVKFTVIDGMVPPLFSNVRSVVFKDQEGGFLAGMLAAMASKSGVVGFVGGMDVPIIRNFAYGFEQGAKHARPDIKILRNMIGNSRAAWNNPARASAITEEMFRGGADVIFGCAGGSSLGVLLAANKNEKLAIGIDANQNGLYPGSVLTSLIKRVDKAVYDTLRATQDNSWEAGIKYMGISESALDYTVDLYNKKLITKEMVDKVEAAKDMIIRGSLEVQSYSPN
jgi:basic membrane protein A